MYINIHINNNNDNSNNNLRDPWNHASNPKNVILYFNREISNIKSQNPFHFSFHLTEDHFFSSIFTEINCAFYYITNSVQK